MALPDMTIELVMVRPMIYYTVPFPITP